MTYSEYKRQKIQSYFKWYIAKPLSFVLNYLFVVSIVLSGVGIWYRLYGNMIMNHVVPDWVSICSVFAAIVGILALHLSYKCKIIAMKVIQSDSPSKAYDIHYTLISLRPLRIMSVIFLIVIAAFTLFLPHYPILSGIIIMISYISLFGFKRNAVTREKYI